MPESLWPCPLAPVAQKVAYAHELSTLFGKSIGADESTSHSDCTCFALSLFACAWNPGHHSRARVYVCVSSLLSRSMCVSVNPRLG